MRDRRETKIRKNDRKSRQSRRRCDKRDRQLRRRCDRKDTKMRRCCFTSLHPAISEVDPLKQLYTLH